MATDTLTAQELTDLRLGTLNTAVADWKTMVGRLERLATGGDGEVSATDLEKRANAANWKGVNATVSREFVTKTAAQFADAAAAAKSVLAVLRDADTAFKKHKEDLRAATDELAKSNIYVNGNGNVAASVPSGAAAGNADIRKPTDEELDVAQSRITKILWEATETDRIAARALRQLAKNKYDFTDQGPNSLKDADRAQGRADAEYWRKEVAKGNVDEWSKEKLARFNETLENQRDNPGFTETFATGLGADGTLQFWRDLAAPPGGAVEGDRAKMMGHVQDNLSMALANASHSDSPEMTAWKKDVIASGTKIFPVDSAMPMGPNGFQVMSSLMGKGKFDDDFLHDYGNAVLKHEREYPGDPGVAWRDTTALSYPPTGNPNDPVAGFMEALGHNPEASLEFFNDSTTAGGKTLDNWDYLVAKGDGAREWPLGEDGKALGHDPLGHALESATIGVPYDSDATPPKHSAGGAELFNRIVGEFGKNPDRLDGSPMSDSLGHISAEYMRDIQDGINGQSDIKTFGANAELAQYHEDGTLANFLGGVGKDPEAYGSILNAQQAVSTELINEAYHDKDKYDQFGLEVTNRVSPGSEIAGIMAEARAQSVYDDQIAKDEEFNKSLTTTDKWAGRAIDMGLSRFPVAGELVSPLVEEIRGAVVENYTRDSSDAAGQDKRDFIATQRVQTADAAYDATYTAATQAGIDDRNARSQATGVMEKAKDSYGQGQQAAATG